MNIKDSRYYIIPMPLPTPWNTFLGPIPKNEQWTMLVYGNSHSGKSSFCLKFASILSRFGKILYANTEEDLKGGTIQIKARQNNVDIRSFDFLDETGDKIKDKYNAIIDKLKSQDYKFCIIDSISAFAMTKNEVVDTLNLAIEFPKTSFVFITHMTKDEKTFAGYGMIKYLVDIAIHLSEGVADCSAKNRYKANKANNKLILFKVRNNVKQSKELNNATKNSISQSKKGNVRRNGSGR